MQKYQTSKKNILLLLLIISLWIKYSNKKLDAKIKNKKLINKSDIFGFIYNSDLDKKIEWLAAKKELKEEQRKILKLQPYESFYFSKLPFHWGITKFPNFNEL